MDQDSQNSISNKSEINDFIQAPSNSDFSSNPLPDPNLSLKSPRQNTGKVLHSTHSQTLQTYQSPSSEYQNTQDEILNPMNSIPSNASENCNIFLRRLYHVTGD